MEENREREPETDSGSESQRVHQWWVTVAVLSVVALGPMVWLRPDRVFGPPDGVDVFAPQSGSLEFQVEPAQKLNPGEIIAVMGSADLAKRLLKLEAQLVALPMNPTLNPDRLPKAEDHDFGRITPSYESFRSACDRAREIRNESEADPALVRAREARTAYKAELWKAEAELLDRQKILNEAQRRHQRVVTIRREGIISEDDVTVAHDRMREAWLSRTEHLKVLGPLRAREEDLNARVKEAVFERSKVEQATVKFAQQRLEKLISDLEAWKEEHVIQAPVAGEIWVPKAVRRENRVVRGDLVAKILPTESAD